MHDLALRDDCVALDVGAEDERRSAALGGVIVIVRAPVDHHPYARESAPG